jgi:EAL domain-containing protein (putative c-di-GMP-specific phosphodiesterase class I)
MVQQQPPTRSALKTFGQRKIVPRACIANSKPHIRDFLCEALEELGFIASACDDPATLKAVVPEHHPDLIVLGQSGDAVTADATLEQLARLHYGGRILILGPSAAPMVTALLDLGAKLGLAMLPLLSTPFSDRDLRDRVAPLLMQAAPPNPIVDIGEALHANWLELWYQPKVEARSLTLAGAEALIRLRHPTWGTVLPARFLPDHSDPHSGALSEFVMARATRDWSYFATSYGHVEIAINLPVAFFEHPQAVAMLAKQKPDDPAFQGLIVEFNSDEFVRHAALATRAARQLQAHNIAVAIDDLGADWPLLLEINDFPFAEIKVDRAFVGGCADDRLKQSVCRRILELADNFGVRTVAEGVETRADFIAARELGFDLIQGFFFGRPMEPHKFARRILGKPITVCA